MKHSKLITRSGTTTVGTGLMNVVNDAQQVDVEDLDRAVLIVVQDTDPGAGTATLVVEKTYDGTTWIAFGASLTDASFTAADGAAVERAHETTAGMPLRCKAFRVRLTALSAGGAYSIKASGTQVEGYKS